MRDERRWLGDVPIRLCDHETNPPRGTIVFYHGLGASIAAQTTELHSLARAGFRVVGVDAVGHGVRRWPDFDARFSPEHVQENLEDVLRASVAELPRLLDVLIEQGLADPDRLGLAGISMGGFIAYGAVIAEPRLRVVSSILGSPRWPGLPEVSPHAHPGGFFPTALLSQNAALDENVPAEETRAFHAQLEPHYMTAPDRLRYIEHAGCGHFMPADRWEVLWTQVVEWFLRHLSA